MTWVSWYDSLAVSSTPMCKIYFEIYCSICSLNNQIKYLPLSSKLFNLINLLGLSPFFDVRAGQIVHEFMWVFCYVPQS